MEFSRAAVEDLCDGRDDTGSLVAGLGSTCMVLTGERAAGW